MKKQILENLKKDCIPVELCDVNEYDNTIEVIIPRTFGFTSDLLRGFDFVTMRNFGDKYRVVLSRPIEKKKGYYQRTKELVLEANPGYETWEKSPYKVIDYPLEKTVAILFPKRPGVVIGVLPDRLRKYNAELRLFKPVKNGTIIAYHFND